MKGLISVFFGAVCLGLLSGEGACLSIDARHSPRLRRQLIQTSAEISQKISDLSKEASACILTRGVNTAMFSECFGSGYSVLSRKYLDYFNQLVLAVVTDLKNNLYPRCTKNLPTCESFVAAVQAKIQESKNVTPEIRRLVVDYLGSSGLPSTTIRKIATDLIAEYTQMLAARTDLAKKLDDNIIQIQGYIKKTGIPTDFDFTTVDRTVALDVLAINIIDLDDELSSADDAAYDYTRDFLSGKPTVTKKKAAYVGTNANGQSVYESNKSDESIGSQIKVYTYSIKNFNPKVDVNQRKKLTVNKNRFFSSLVAELQPLNQLQFYLGSGRVDPKNLDLSELPSYQIQKILQNNLASGKSV